MKYREPIPPKRPAKKKGNKKIGEYGKNTQFQKGHTPTTAAPDAHIKPWAYRKELQYLAVQEISSDPAKFDAEIKRLMNKRIEGKSTVARMFACRMLEKAIKKMEPNMCEKVIDNTEGKLSQEIIVPPFTPAPTTFKTLAEAEEAYKNHMKR